MYCYTEWLWLWLRLILLLLGNHFVTNWCCRRITVAAYKWALNWSLPVRYCNTGPYIYKHSYIFLHAIIKLKSRSLGELLQSGRHHQIAVQMLLLLHMKCINHDLYSLDTVEKHHKTTNHSRDPLVITLPFPLNPWTGLWTRHSFASNKWLKCYV